MEKFIMNIELKDNESTHGGIAHVGYTLGDYLNDSEIDYRDIKFGEMSMADLNNDLEESGIKAITVQDLLRAVASYIASVDSIDHWQAKEIEYHLKNTIPLAEQAKGSFKDKERCIGEMRTLKESMRLITLYHRVY